jgi:hypothetical protein
MTVVMDLAKQTCQANIPIVNNVRRKQKQQHRQLRPGVRFEQTQTNSHAQSTKSRQSDAMVDDINDKPKNASRVR